MAGIHDLTAHDKHLKEAVEIVEGRLEAMERKQVRLFEYACAPRVDGLCVSAERCGRCCEAGDGTARITTAR